jgi:hypothetical protein
VGLSFDTVEETIAWADWLAEQRRQYQSRPAMPPPVFIVAPSQSSTSQSSSNNKNGNGYDDDDAADDSSRSRHGQRSSKEWNVAVHGMEETYAYMKNTFRFRLLEQLGIDLTIAPEKTLIDASTHRPTFRRRSK